MYSHAASAYQAVPANTAAQGSHMKSVYGSPVNGGYGGVYGAPVNGGYGYTAPASYGGYDYTAPAHGGYTAPASYGGNEYTAPGYGGYSSSVYGGYGGQWNAPNSPYGGYLMSGNYYPSYVYQNIGYGPALHGSSPSPIRKGY